MTCRPISSIQVRCNRMQSHAIATASPPAKLLQYLPSSHHSLESPLIIPDQEAREHKPRQCLLLHGRLPGQSWACVIVAGDCEHLEKLGCAIGRKPLAEEKWAGELVVAKKADEYRSGRCDEETLQGRGCSEVGGSDCASINKQRRSQDLCNASLRPANR